MRGIQLAMASAATELKLHTRSLGFWVLMVSWQAAAIFLAPHYADPALSALDRFSFSMMPMLATVFTVYVTQVAARDRREGTVETVDALPAAFPPRAWGRFLSLMVVIGLIALGPLAVTVWGAEPGSLQPSALLYWAMAYGANLVFALLIGFLAGSLIANPFLAYPLAAGSWVGWHILFAALVPWRPTFAWWWVFSPFDPSARWHGTSLLWGAFPTGALAFPHYALNIALSTAAAALAILLLKRARDRDYVRLGTVCVLVVSLIAGGASLGAFLGNYALIKESHRVQIKLLRETPALQGSSPGPADPDAPAAGFEIATYSGTLDLGPGRAMRMIIDLALDVPREAPGPGGDGAVTLEFTLNGLFRVTSCKAGPSPTRLEDCGFSQHGHSLAVRIPAEDGQGWPSTGVPGGQLPPAGAAGGAAGAGRVIVRLEYGADEVWVWNEDTSGGLQLVACVDRAGTLLPAGFAWYPLPGRWQTGYLVGHGLRSGAPDGDPRYWTICHYDLPFPDSQWDLTVSQHWPDRGGGEPAQELVLGVVPRPPENITSAGVPSAGAPSAGVPGGRSFTGRSHRGCFLIGAPAISAAETGGVALFCPPAMTRLAQRLADYLSEALRYLETAGLEFDRPFVAAIVPVGGMPGLVEQAQLGGDLSITESQALFEVQALQARDPERLARQGSLVRALLERAVVSGDPREIGRGAGAGPEQAEVFWGVYYVGEAFKGFLSALVLEELCGKECYAEAVRAAMPRVRHVEIEGRQVQAGAFDDALALLDGFHGRYGDGPSMRLCRALLEGVRATALGPEGLAEKVAAYERAVAGGGSR